MIRPREAHTLSTVLSELFYSVMGVCRPEAGARGEVDPVQGSKTSSRPSLVQVHSENDRESRKLGETDAILFFMALYEYERTEISLLVVSDQCVERAIAFIY